MSRLFAFLVAAFLSLGSSLAFAQAGYVHDLKGTASATANGATRALKIGDTLNAGTTVNTGANSSAVIKFEDGQLMVLAEKTSFRVVDYRYNKQRVADSSAVFALLQGGLRFISGVIGSTNRNNFRMSAGTATIGIRGTDGAVTIDAITQAVTAAVNAGALVMTTAQGSREIGVGNFASASPNQAPTLPAPTAQATAAVQQTLNSLAATQNLPINTPIVVQASAQAAAAQAQATELAARAAAQPNNPALQRAAAEATAAAQSALATAINAAVQANTEATQAGAVAPAPAAPPPPPPSSSTTGTSTTSSTGTTDPTANLPPPGDSTTTTTTTTTTSPTGAGGAGGGGTATCGTTSTSPC